MKIAIIKPEEAYPIRHKVLRQGRPLAECFYSGDESPTSFHLGAFDDKRLISVASFHLEFNPKFSETIQFRLRGMATLPEARSTGAGTAVLKAGEDVVKTRFGNLLWFYARIGAFAFYEQNGFEYLGELFDIPDIGPHKIMFKRY